MANKKAIKLKLQLNVMIKTTSEKRNIKKDTRELMGKLGLVSHLLTVHLLQRIRKLRSMQKILVDLQQDSMFTLEIIDQLTKGDLTKGYNIAGTGEMLENGDVGRIGGIDKKVIAADDAGVEIFFAPDDTLPEEVKKKYPRIQSNYQEAVKEAKKIGTAMKIVPVKNVDDALNYLEKLPEKK